MRTTVTLADDVMAEVERLRRENGLGLSDALNELARRGFRARPRQAVFRQRSMQLGQRLDVSNVAEVLDALDDR